MVRVQIYTNDREQPIDLEVQQMRTQAREIITNENGHHRGPSIAKQGASLILFAASMWSRVHHLFVNQRTRSLNGALP